MALPNYIVNYTQGNECGLVNGGLKGFLNLICRGSVINVMNINKIDAMQIEAVIMFVAVLGNILFIGFLELKMELMAERY